MNKIDFVITWVDGNDPEWQKERNYYANVERARNEYNPARFRDWGVLKYWFRGVEKYTPWVNNIFFLTCGQLPEWLDTNNPKLKIVKHEDFIPAEYLPTFNSYVIEFYMHKIKGLSEQFVYFNDDMFVLRPIVSTRFFRKGLPCDLGGMTVNIHVGMFGANVLLAKTLINEHFRKREVVRKNISKWFNITYVRQSIINLICVLVRKDEFVGFVNPHIPQAYLKKVYEEVWNKCEKDLLRTSYSKFRDYGDICHWIIRYWQLASGYFTPYNTLKDSCYFVVKDDTISDITNCICQQKKELICINDSEKTNNYENLKNMVVKAFDELLPEKCSFEL